ncbi:hypothetical protein HPB49_008609 [Dermacentor silvarum]|uniref:Uncharacterized protein n=1 Tax=Dermacentor silvarum TaxID=543639 RepID=A0ACB8DXF0_DERSI|nr:hypothetical protein HPB49_008609 [Dermacentor silvarum]
MDSSSASKTTWSDAETRAIIHLWEEHLPDLRRAERNLKVYAAIAENLQALGFDKSTKEILEEIARGDPLQDNQSSDGCPSPLPGMTCCPPPCASPPEAGNSCLQSPPDTGTAGPSCEAGLDVSCTNPATKKRKRQPAPSTLVMQLLDEQCQLRISSEPRKDRELQLREEQLKVFKQIASIDERLLSVLEKLANK